MPRPFSMNSFKAGNRDSHIAAPSSGQTKSREPYIILPAILTGLLKTPFLSSSLSRMNIQHREYHFPDG